MEYIINTLLAIGIIAFVIWLFWNVLEVAYHIVMIVLCAIGYTVVTAFEAVAFVVKWTLIKPIKSIIKICKS